MDSGLRPHADAMDDWVRLFASRDEMADEYARWILNAFTDDWRQINAAIIRRWSESGLLYVKRKAWGILREQEEMPRPEVKRLCRRCRPKLYPGDASANLVIVSPLGTGHWGDGGSTQCGRDATGERWWWPL